MTTEKAIDGLEELCLHEQEMTDAEKLKQIKTVIEAGCNEECEHCGYTMYYGYVCDSFWSLDQIARIVGADV